MLGVFGKYRLSYTSLMYSAKTDSEMLGVFGEQRLSKTSVVYSANID